MNKKEYSCPSTTKIHPFGLNIIFWWMKYLIHVDEQYFHIVGEKKVGIECKFLDIMDPSFRHFEV
jgi:hypothetical protein